MRMKIVSGFAAAAFGTALTVGFGAPAQAAAPANYSRACTEVVASSGFVNVEKAVTAYGMARRSARRTARRTSRRHSY
jgi:hypothetical protein